MIKKIIPLLGLVLLMSSCSNQLSILKRHYNKGFYVANGKNIRRGDVVKRESKSAEVKKMNPTVSSFIAGDENKNLEYTAGSTNRVTKEEKKTTFQSQLKKHTPVYEKRKMVSKAQEQNSRKLFSLHENQKNTKGSSGDTNLIILVILCLFPFINLIAMYLKDGNTITLNFLVCLILDLLFFLPGIIFALLVVFDVVNLKK